MIANLGRVSLFLLIHLWVLSLTAQECKLPILSGFNNQTTNSVELTWLDFNQGSSLWDIEYGLKGFNVTGNPTLSNLSQKMVLVDNLESSMTYEFYLRANCESGSQSDWNGPYFTNTVIDNNFSCGLSFELSDNNCPAQDNFKIEVTGYKDLLLGSEVVLEYVDLIVEHPWPPDLRVKLISPDGREIRLTTNNGKGIDDYGDTSTGDCALPARFTDNACQSIDVVAPPFVGQYRPEETLSELYSLISPDGIWELSICDHASGDIGFLNYIKLNFSELACIVPPSFTLGDVEADNVTCNWTNTFSCQALEFVYKKKNAPVQNSFSEYAVCGEETFTILDLEPNTEYELIIRADCGSAVFSPASCVIAFTTACQNSNIREAFDMEESCNLSCSDNCAINSIWNNADTNQSNWLVNRGPTPTSFTGPESDYNNLGAYIYIENQDNVCSEALDIILESACLEKPNIAPCSVSFSYHMYGQDIGSLSVEYSLDSENWTELWQLSGNQGNNWQTIAIDLPISFERGKLRFVAFKKPLAVRGDIALDNIKLIGIDTISPLLLYQDLDNDGYGNLNKPILSCSNEVLSGYAMNGEDCNDLSPSIFPGAIEIKCNQIDENCNGLNDDVDTDQIGYVLGSIRSESCKGSFDGFATIQGLNGQEPYSYEWSNGDKGQGVTDLTTGIYYCTITDIGGCQIVSDPIFIGFMDILVYSVRSILRPSCVGEDNGQLELRIEGGIPPYTVEWNNGRRGSSISGLVDGLYSATITDGSSCELVTDSILLEGPQILTTGVQQKIDVDCNGNLTGLIRLGILGGNPPYDILWSNGVKESIIDNIPSGLYSATVTDQNGCYSILKDVELVEKDLLEIFLVSVEHISCPEESNSLIDINVMGGTPPYSYFWDDGTNRQDLIGQKAGIYNVTVSDFNSCSTSLLNIEINQPEDINITISELQNVNCSGSNNGRIEVSVIGGTAPYLYNWGSRDGEETAENFLSDLTFGNYSLTVVDDFNCKSEAVTIVVVNNAIPLEVNLETVSELDCYGDSTAIISAQVGTALAPLDFNWSSGQNLVTSSGVDTLSGLMKGAYNLTVTDSEGCVGVGDTISIDEPEEVKYELVSLADNSCWYESSGELEISIAGGESPYSIRWSDGSVGQSLSGLKSGNYSATITDFNNCETEIENLSINNRSKIDLDLSLVQPTESQLGKITVEPEGGLPPYQYQWGPPIQFLNSPIAENLNIGNYELRVTDNIGCVIDTLIELKMSSSIDELSKTRRILISPNPTSGIFTISIEEGVDYQYNISIYNSNGIVMQNEILRSNPIQQIDISTFQSGIYFLRLESTTASFVTKIVLVH